MAGKTINKLKISKQERDRFTIVLEAIQSDFKVFGEKLDLVDDKVDRVVNDAEHIKGAVDRLIIEVAIIKEEIRDLKDSLSQKEDLKRLKDLEKRVGRIETMLAKR